ncbi:MAG: DUF4340 domain-containing protein [Bacteroidetes bacterium]|nr:DUF4340 domain-containing protein [Bacteroidota bacterium]
MSNKARLILLAAVAAGLAWLWWWGGRDQQVAEQRTFRATLLSTDTAALRSFTILPAPVEHLPALHFQRDSSGWTVASDSSVFRAFQRPMNELLAKLAHIRPVSVAGSGKDIRERYRLVDSTATTMELPGASGGTLRVGASTGGANTATAMMLEGDTNVYLVPGLFHEVTGMSFIDWIPKPLVNGDPRNWDRVTFVFPGRHMYSLERNKDGWTVNGSPADSIKVGKYLWALSRYYGHGLMDPADTLQAELIYSMRVEDRSRPDPIILGIFNTPKGLMARSTLAPPWMVMPIDAKQELARMFRPPEAFMAH